MQLTPEADPNTRSYFIMEVQTKRRIPVRFEPLTSADTPELVSEAWADAVFAPVWQQLIGVPEVYKLALVETPDQSFVGLLQVGEVTLPYKQVEHSLLETAPANRRGGFNPRYSGVGRVLIARLVTESMTQGGQGRVVVRPRLGTEPFYRALGFVPVAPHSPRFVLREKDAELLLDQVT